MDVRLPNLGEGVDSGSVVTLFVKEGDVITKGQTLLELENEKAVAPIPSPQEGRVSAIRVKPGDKITVGQIILTLNPSGAGEATPAAPAAAPAAEPPKERRPGPQRAPDRSQEDHEGTDEVEPAGRPSQKAGFPPPASPSIRKLARDLGLDLNRVRGSQAGGRIVLEDIRAYIQRLQQLAAEKRKGPPVRMPSPEPIDFTKWGPVTSKPMSQLRQVISRRMADSWSTIPHVTQFDEADITGLNELRKKFAPAYEAQRARLTVTSFILRAVAGLLRKHPEFNASIDESSNHVVLKDYVHIGLAVDTEAGLLVAVLRDVERKSLLQLSKEVQELGDKARNRTLSAEEMKGGSFTISNQGGIGGGHFTPIINKPEVAILGLGRGAMKPAVKDNQIRPRLLLPLALSYDHRLIDGANAARFIVDLVAALESFKEDDVRL